MSQHDGHRQRLKERFLKEGLDHFSDVQVLELLLFYAIPRQDTNPIAHNLLEHFGSLAQVLEAPVEELEKVPGIGRNAAILLSLSTSLGRYYQVERAMNIRILRTVEECGEYLVPFFYGRRNETVFLLCLDAKCKVLCCKEIGEGSVNSAGVPIRRIVDNHPSGLALPSGEDITTTCRVAAALSAVEINLADHIVVADDDFVSIAQSGYYRPEDCSVL